MWKTLIEISIIYLMGVAFCMIPVGNNVIKHEKRLPFLSKIFWDNVAKSWFLFFDSVRFYLEENEYNKKED